MKANHAGEFIRHDEEVGVNHAGEFIRHYLPFAGASFHDAQQKTHRGHLPPVRYGRNQSLAQALGYLVDKGALIPAIHEVGVE